MTSLQGDREDTPAPEALPLYQLHPRSLAQPLQLRTHDLFQSRRLVEVGKEFLCQAFDLLADGLVVAIVDLRCADVAAGREDMVMLADLIQLPPGKKRRGVLPPFLQ